MIQEVNTLVTTRVPLLSEFDRPSTFSAIPTLANRANRYFYWDANGNPAATLNPIFPTNYLALDRGTDTAPTYTFFGDLDTGMWSPNVNTIAFSTTGIEAMRITPGVPDPETGDTPGELVVNSSLQVAGNVGIGTQAPSAKLHVQGNTRLAGSTTLAAPNTNAAAWTTAGINLIQSAATFTDITSSGSVPAISINNFAAQTLAATNSTTVTRLYGTFFVDPVAGTNVTATERFALGADTLRVIGNSSFGGTINGSGISITGGVQFTTVGSAINIGTSQTTGTLIFGNTAGTGTITLGQSTISQTTNIQAGITASGSTKTINIGTNGASGSTTNINIGSATSGANQTTTISGNVGIGTSSPASKLDVNGTLTSGNISARGDGSEGGQITLLNAANSAGPLTLDVDASGNGRLITTVNNANLSLGQLSGTGGIIQFYTANGERMRINSTGNVGIGTISPEAVLDVNGGQVTRGDASGYVYFAPKIGTTPFGTNYDRFEIRVDPANPVTLLGNTHGGTGAARALAFLAGTNERFRILTTGGITSSDLPDAVGYKGLPQNSQAASYTLALSDMGKHISTTTGGVVIPPNSGGGSVAFPIGTTIVIYNNSNIAQNISITTDTLRLAGTATTGTRSLAQRGLATCVKVLATEWVVSGNVT
jgi:hypothetical protein